MITRREALRLAGIGGAALTLPAFLAACGDDESKGKGGRGSGGADIDHVTWSLGAKPETLDIATAFNSQAMTAMSASLECLLTIRADYSLEPLLAESWRQPDPLHFVYAVREGVRFWDGTPMTAQDVAFSLGRHADPRVASQLAAYFVNVRSVEVTGEREVTVTMRKPDQLFQYVPTFTYVTPKAFSEKLGKRLGVPGPEVSTMGTGPYRITAFSDAEVSLERNEQYWGRRPAVRAASLTYVDNPRTNLLAARAGELDGIFEFPVADASDWDRLDGVATRYTPGLRTFYLSFDLDMEPWNDVHVRRAIAHAIDQEGYINAFLDGKGRQGRSIVAEAQWGSLVSREEVEAIYSEFPAYPFDLEQARAELAQSRFPDGFSASMEYPNHDPIIGRVLVSLSESLKEIGIELKVREVDRNKWGADLYAHVDLGLTFGSLGPDYADPANFPMLLFPSANAVKNNFNTANWRNPEVDELIERQAGETDAQARAEQIGQALRIAAEELPYAPLFFRDSSMALDDAYAYDSFNALFYETSWLGNVGLRA